MKSKSVSGPSQRSWMLVFESEDEPVALLTQFADANDIAAASISGIGGFAEVTLGYFSLQKREYERIPVREQVEVMSLTGNIARFEGKAKLHVHVVIGKSDGSAHGGHLLDARVKPTLEVVVMELPGELHRTVDPVTGLPLLRP